ncbi:MAG TPA: biopolymer transporter ExbD [Flavobacteriales bacterium]|nr:biopolymer transporter ExbD [Flavobacteriales bacterium]
MRLRSSNKIDAGFSLSSMTDLVFLLLIFFVIISTMVSPTTMPVDLPISANKTKEKPRVGVRIDADGAFSVNDIPVDPLDLEGVLQDRMAPIQDKNPSLVIHVDQRVPAGITVGVMDIAKRNNWKVIIATRPK